MPREAFLAINRFRTECVVVVIVSAIASGFQTTVSILDSDDGVLVELPGERLQYIGNAVQRLWFAKAGVNAKIARPGLELGRTIGRKQEQLNRRRPVSRDANHIKTVFSAVQTEVRDDEFKRMVVEQEYGFAHVFGAHRMVAAQSKVFLHGKQHRRLVVDNKDVLHYADLKARSVPVSRLGTTGQSNSVSLDLLIERAAGYPEPFRCSADLTLFQV